MKRLIGIGALSLALIAVGNNYRPAGAQTITQHYLILGSGQGPGSASFAQTVSSANGTVTKEQGWKGAQVP